MKSAIISLVVILWASKSFSQNPSAALVMTGNSFRQEGAVTRARGSVVVKVDMIELHADEVDFNSATGELEARGHVTVGPAGSAPPPTPSPVVPDKAELQLKLEAARTKLARAEDLAGKGLAPRAEVERAQQEFDQLKAQSPAAAPTKSSGSAAAWSMQTDALKMQVPPASH